MKTKMPLLLIFLLATGSAGAVSVEFSFPYDRVELKSGKVHDNVTLTSYNSLSGRVSAQSTGKLFSLRLIDLPETIAERIRQQVPQMTTAEIEAEIIQATEMEQEAKRRKADWERRRIAEAKADRDAKRNLDVRQAEEAEMKQTALEEKVYQDAQSIARHYFEYEADPYSSMGYVFNSNIMLEYPEAVAGWRNRWRLKGKVGVRYVTNTFGSVGRNSREFEIMIETADKGFSKLIDITVK